MATPRDDLLDGCARAQLAELAWIDERGRADWAVVMPFVLDGAPMLALTYDRLELARSVAASPHAALTLATPAVLRGARPTACTGQVTLEDDPRGRRFRDRLLRQELATYPPARRLADSLLLQREHWWYLPRLLLTFSDGGEARHLDAATAVAAVVPRTHHDGEEPLVVAGCDVEDRGTSAVLRHSSLPDGPVAVLEHGGEVPELESRWHLRLRGELRGGEVTIEERDHEPPTGARPGLVTRWRRQRRLERGCRAGLRAAGHH